MKLALRLLTHRERAHAPATGRAPMLVALRGAMRGTRLPLRHGCTIIGRDAAECHVVYDAAATAISRRHCTITFDVVSGTLTLEDDGSSNGTYVRRGVRLDPMYPTPVAPGTRFWLGSPDELWQIIGGET